MRSHRRFEFSPLAACAMAGWAVAATAQPQRTEPPVEAIVPSSSDAPRVSDAQLGLEARARLFEALGISNLSVLVDQGVATVDGTVRSDADRRRAEEIVREVRGIRSVVNELGVANSATIARADEAAAVTARENAGVEYAVAERLRADALLGSRSIHVAADELGNTVTLTGTVSTEEERRRAGEIAASAIPDGNVRNQLEVRQRL